MRLRSSASLRIMSEESNEDISEKLQMVPTFSNTKGEKARFGDIVFESNIWGLASPLTKDSSPDDHLKWIIGQFKDRYDVLREISKLSRVDVFLALTSIDQTGFGLTPEAMSIFTDLNISFEVSLIFHSDE